jgi:organic radical activating enzyme
VILTQIELTNYCNFHCHGCLSDKAERDKGFMNWDNFKKSIELCKAMDVQEVWLQNWGEPLLHPDIIPFIKYASKSIKTCFITNGSLLNTYSLSQIKDAGAHKINLSINGSTPSNMYYHLKEMYDFANNIGLDCWWRSVIFYENEYKKLSKLLHDEKVNWQRGMIHDKRKVRTEICKAIDKNMIILWNGKIVPCCQVADEECCYAFDMRDINHTTKQINYGINDIKANFKSYEICKYCHEVDIDIPIGYKL